MDITKAVTLFEELRSKVNEHQSYLSRSETVTRVLLVDPVLEMLGWDVRNPDIVELEFKTADSKREKADYVLKNEDRSVAIVEAKSLGTDISELKHLIQADNYARFAGVTFFVLTNGASWALYERDLMTSLETLKPIVEFDYRRNDPIRCALDALSLWNENLRPGTTPITAYEPFLKDAMSTNQGIANQTSTKSVYQQTQITQISDAETVGINAIDTDWFSIADESLSVTGTKIMAIKIQGVIQPETNEQIGKYRTRTGWNWSDFTRLIATWLVNEGKLKPYDCPVYVNKTKPKNKCLINNEPIHPDGTHFRRGAIGQLPKGMWLNTGHSAEYHLKLTCRLLKKFDVNLDVVEIKVEKRNQ